MRPRRETSFLREHARRAVFNRRVFPYLALTTLAIALIGAFVETLVDRKDFPNFWLAAWWAIVTLGTVGYGDVVPTTVLGRIAGSALIIFGVTFISFLTAVVTSMFVSAEQREQRAQAEARRDARDDETRELLRDLAQRMTAIEDKLDRRS